jgi:uncharacterized protein (DUF1684 family)
MNTFSAIPTFLTLTIIAGFLLSCNLDQQKSDANYKAEIDKWHEQRVESLKEEDSWLSLAGLYELDEGTHSLGSDSGNDIVFPSKASSQIGTITKKDENFTIDVQSSVTVTQDGEEISEMELTTSSDGEPTELRYNNLLWYIIERRGDYYIRLKDTNHPNFSSFNGIDRFPVSKEWRVEASFNRFDKPQLITIPDILGKQYQDSLYGTLDFTVDGKQYSLAPLGNPDKDEEFFIIFGDQTNGESTYSGGRYIYISTPNKNGTTNIDFNKAYNPPCVFTDYATCPLPPSQNRLELKVTAGEKMYRK